VVASTAGDDALCRDLVTQFLTPHQGKRNARTTPVHHDHPVPASHPVFGLASRPYRPIIAGISANGAAS